MSLISLPHHLESVVDDGDTLIVSCDWLTWQRCKKEGLPCVYFESEIDTKKIKSDPADLFVRSYEWVFSKNKDLTEFHGVSIGRIFVREIYPFFTWPDKLEPALRGLIEKFKPHEIVYFEFRADTVVFDPISLMSLTKEVAEECGVKFINKMDPTERNDPYLPFVNSGKVSFFENKPPPIRRFVQWAYEKVLVLTSRLLAKDKKENPSILFYGTHLNGLPLIHSLNKVDTKLSYFVEQLPNKRHFFHLLRAFRAGLVLVERPGVSLGKEDIRQLEIIKQRVLAHWAKTTEDAFGTILKDYIRKNILESNRLLDAARTVLFAEKFFKENNISLLFTDGMQNPVSTTLMAIANKNDIKVALTWHGLYTIDIKFDIFGSDPRIPSVVDYCLTWGAAHEAWLENITANVRKIRCGNMIAAQSYSRPPATKKKPTDRSVLVLQNTGLFKDIYCSHAQQFIYFVEIMLMLEDLGYKKIIFRLHPGAIRTDYYHEIAELFGIECEISDSGPFKPLLEESDIVIGSAVSGTAVESINAGRPYFIVLPQPHALNLDYYDKTPVYSSYSSLKQTLHEKIEIDQIGFCEDFTASTEYPDPVERTWGALKSIENHDKQPF